jgi:simple sugar transport system permease protein
VAIPVLSDIPVIGRVLFDQDPLVYVSLLAFAGVAVFLRHTRGGLLLRAVGEDPEAANANGLRVLLGAYLFGAASILHLVLQGLGWNISTELLAMLPYVVTILMLVLLSWNPVRTHLNTPLSLGQPYRPGR